jgi:hypothetical protein
MQGGGAVMSSTCSGDAGDGGGAAGIGSTPVYAMRRDGADMRAAIVVGGVRDGEGGVGVLAATSKSGFMGHASCGGHGPLVQPCGHHRIDPQ